jgi:hypothetical protein
MNVPSAVHSLMNVEINVSIDTTRNRYSRFSIYHVDNVDDVYVKNNSREEEMLDEAIESIVVRDYVHVSMNVARDLISIEVYDNEIENNMNMNRTKSNRQGNPK